MAQCDEELCPHWTGDGRVCGCVMLGLEPGDAAKQHRREFGITCNACEGTGDCFSCGGEGNTDAYDCDADCRDGRCTKCGGEG